MKTLKQKRGISTIIAVLLMIVISVAAAVITYIWVMGYLGGTMAGIKQTSEQMQISIDQAWNTTTTTGFSVVVRNVGDIEAVVDKVYVGTSSSNLQLATGVSQTPIAVGSSATVNCTAPFTFAGDTTYVVKVVCTDGQSAIATFTT